MSQSVAGAVQADVGGDTFADADGDLFEVPLAPWRP
jgi:hypothetical protein